MDPQPAVVTLRFNKFLPYWAVLQTDLRQTLRGWVYRLWVLVTIVAVGGILLYKVGIHKEAGISQSAAAQCGDLFRIMVVGSLALVVVLAVSAVGAERGTVADSVLSRGISRHQYFLAKLHARLATVLLPPPRLVRCSMLTVGGIPVMRSTSGRESCSTNWRAYRLMESRNRRCPSANSVSNASELFPEPLKPVMTIS